MEMPNFLSLMPYLLFFFPYIYISLQVNEKLICTVILRLPWTISRILDVGTLMSLASLGKTLCKLQGRKFYHVLNK